MRFTFRYLVILTLLLLPSLTLAQGVAGNGGTGIAGNTAGGSGNVTGPPSAITNNLPIFSSSTGKVLGDSGVAVSSLAATNSANTFTAAQTFSATGSALIVNNNATVQGTLTNGTGAGASRFNQ